MEGTKLPLAYRKTLIIVLGSLVAFCALYLTAKAQGEGLIYGKVYTYNQTYKGQIRWGKEEAFWNDFFNAGKVSHEYYQFLIEKENKKESRDSWYTWDWNISSIWDDKGHVKHEFSTQFGNIASIIIKSKSRVDLQLKNGTQLRLSGVGYNDIGTKIIVYDEELGKIKLDWSRVEKVEFLPTPANLNISGGNPLFGTVETYRRGTYTGYIQWDHDERLGDDVLDGDSKNGDMSIPFAKIASIQKEGNGSLVTMQSGRSFLLRGSNDVNNENDGLLISVSGVGKIDVPWKVFEKVTFQKASGSGRGYNSYKTPKGLRGTVYTFDRLQYSGKIIYDLDEALEVETLEAKDDDIEYIIPFGNIGRIIPRNSQYADVELKNGRKLLLGDGRDVSSRNDGILVIPRNKKPIYIDWGDVAEIKFD